MNAVRYRARADTRFRRLPLGTLALLTGLAAAVSMALFAGAGRTESAYARYRQATGQPDAILYSGEGVGIVFSEIDLDRVATLPEVASVERGWTAQAVVAAPDGRPLFWEPAPDGSPGGAVGVNVLPPGGRFRPKVVEGRLPDPDYPTEVAVAWETLSEWPRPHVGDTILVQLLPASFYAGDEHWIDALPELREMEVVGEVVMPGSLGGEEVSIVITPAAWEQIRGETVVVTVDFFYLTGGLDDAASFVSGVRAISPDAAVGTGEYERAQLERGTDLRAVVLRAFGLMVAIGAALVLGQTLVRRTMLAAMEHPTLRALGMTRREVFLVSLWPGVVVGLLGGLIGVAVAVLLSAIFPTGLARLAEPDPGVRLDAGVLPAGTAMTALAPILITAVPAWRMSKARGDVLGTAEIESTSRSRVAAFLSSAGAKPTVVTGAKMAFESGRGRTAAPVRSTIIGLAVAVAVAVTGFGFVQSFDRLTSTKELIGLRGDVAAGHPFVGDLFQEEAIPWYERQGSVTALTAGNFQLDLYLEGSSSDASVYVWGLEAIRGQLLHPGLLEGRWPEAADEIALGRSTLRELGLRVGDPVTVEVGDQRREMRIVGVPVFPPFAFGPGLGEGAGLTMDSLRGLYPDVTRNFVVAELAPGTDRTELFARANQELPWLEGEAALDLDDPLLRGSGNIESAREARTAPLLLAGLFGLAAFAALVNTLVASIRRRRRDLAILKTLGFRRRQVTATALWQAAFIAGVAVALGIPLGAFLGRWAWAMFADRLGVFSHPVTPALALVALVPVAIAAGVIVAYFPGRAAARMSAAQVLRAE